MRKIPRLTLTAFFRLSSEMGSQMPGARNEIAFAPQQKFFQLALGLENQSQARSPPTTGISILAPDSVRLLNAFAKKLQVRRPPLQMITKVDEQARNMAHPAANSSEPQFELIIGCLQKLLVPV